MGYLSLNKITPAAPNDPLVNRVTHLNDNWDEINAATLKMHQASGTLDLFNNPGANSVETGQEIIHLSRKYVWNGSAWIGVIDYAATWSAWTQVPLSANVINRTSFPLEYRTNPDLRRGELRGCIQRDAVPTAWVHNTDVIASNAVSQPIANFPPSVETDFLTGTSLPTTPSTQTAGAHCKLNATNGWQLTVRFRGSAGALNFIALDGMHWWY